MTKDRYENKIVSHFFFPVDKEEKMESDLFRMNKLFG